jgi:translation initiation factor IF-2
MAEKTVKELAQMVQKPVEKLLEQLADAGLPQRTASDLVSESQQSQLVESLKRSHGQQVADSRITLTRKTTSTAKVASTNGKAKTINVEVRKRQTFAKPDAASIAAEARAKADAEAKARADMIARQKAENEAKEKARAEADAKQQATLDAMRAQHSPAKAEAGVNSTVVMKKRPTKEVKPQPSKKDKETPEQRKAREAEEARLKSVEEAARRAAAEEAQQRTLEKMRQMATKYANGEEPAREVEDNSPLARGLVGRAYEESFEKENREIKRGVSTGSTNSRSGKGGRGGRRGQEEQTIRPSHKGLKSSQANKHGFEKPVEKQIYDVQIGETIVVSDLAQKNGGQSA